MENTRAVLVHQSQEPLYQCHTTLNWDVLEYDVRMNEIEPALYPRQRIIAPDEAEVRDAQFFASGSGFSEHGFGDINTENLLAASREWDGQSPHAAAEIESPPRRELLVHSRANYLPGASHVLLTAFEEFAARCVCQPIATKILIREDSPIRLESPEQLPVFIRALPEHPEPSLADETGTFTEKC